MGDKLHFWTEPIVAKPLTFADLEQILEASRAQRERIAREHGITYERPKKKAAGRKLYDRAYQDAVEKLLACCKKP